ncbi:MAG: 6-phosphogluconolactonase [Sphingobacteriaceae bacterium]
MTKNVFKNNNDLLLAMADFFVKNAQKAIAGNDEFNLSLSGGSSPKKLYEMLASPDFNHLVDWKKVNFFFGDERYVSANDPESNALMAKTTLFKPLNIPDDQIFTVNTELSPEEAAKDYARQIDTHFKEKPVRFDLVLLGLGDDAHTASLFPGTTVINETSATIKSVFLSDKNVYRITMTAPLINQAHEVAFMLFGETKTMAVKQVFEGDRNPALYPAQLIAPQDGEVNWFMDEAAAAGLN